jgi:hypothetical protein
MIACENGNNSKVVELLLDRGANIEAEGQV